MFLSPCMALPLLMTTYLTKKSADVCKFQTRSMYSGLLVSCFPICGVSDSENFNHIFRCLGSIVTICLRSISSLFSPNLIDQSSCRILTTHAKAWLILHDDWSIRLGENRPDMALKHLAAMLASACQCKPHSRSIY